MSREQDFSDEFLNAFVDDQLGVDEKGRLYARLNEDENVKRQLCELRTLGDLVRFAYKDLPVPAGGAITGGRQHRIGMGIAAAITLALGIVVGWALHQPLNDGRTEPVVAKVVQPADAGRDVSVTPVKTATATTAPVAGKKPATVADAEVTKVLVHYNSARTSDAGQILDDLEGMLKYYRASGQIARVELIVNSEGLDLLRTDTSRHAERILRMQREFDNLTFVACQNTIDRLHREKGIVARLLPGVVVIDSGVAQLMRRQHQGWAYIQA